MVKPEALERSRSNGSDSWSIPERSLSGNLDTNSLLSEFTEYLRLSLPPIPPLLLGPRIGVFRSVPSISRCVSASLCSYFCSVFVSVFMCLLLSPIISHSTHSSCRIISYVRYMSLKIGICYLKIFLKIFINKKIYKNT